MSAPPSGLGPTLAPRKVRSMKLPGCEWCQCTTLSPANVPMAAPVMTSLAQCLFSYIRDHPVMAAPPYMTGPMTQTDFGHHRLVSDVTADAAANAAMVCPLGNERKSLPSRKPRISL